MDSILQFFVNKIQLSCTESHYNIPIFFQIKKCLIKSYQSSCYNICKRWDFSSGSSRQIHGLTQNSITDLPIGSIILLFQILPQFLLLLQILRLFRANQQNGRYRHHDRQIIQHILSQLLIPDLLELIHIDHALRHKNLLIHSADHNFLVHWLVFSADVIAVKVYIDVIYFPHMR